MKTAIIFLISLPFLKFVLSNNEMPMPFTQSAQTPGSNHATRFIRVHALPACEAFTATRLKKLAQGHQYANKNEMFSQQHVPQ
jgi:hypothetical protein